MKNPIFFCILVVFTIVNIVDGVTAFFILEGEANPLYLITGSIWPVIILKLVINSYIWFYWYRNIYSSNFNYYFIILVSVVGCAMIGIGAYGNILGMLNPEIVEISKQIPTEEKMVMFKTVVLWVYLIPMAFCLFAFWLYDKSLKRIVVNKKYFKWWKL